MANHVQDISALGSVESSLRQAATLSIVADADFATDKATTLANIATRNVNLRPELLPQYYAAIDAVKLGFNLLGATVMITDLATIYAEIEQTWQGGFGVAV
jgi:hypothetical protein